MFSFYTLFCFVLFGFVWNIVDSDVSDWRWWQQMSNGCKYGEQYQGDD